jgi:hypothetical protein
MIALKNIYLVLSQKHTFWSVWFESLCVVWISLCLCGISQSCYFDLLIWITFNYDSNYTMQLNQLSAPSKVKLINSITVTTISTCSSFNSNTLLWSVRIANKNFDASTTTINYRGLLRCSMKLICLKKLFYLANGRCHVT